MTEDVEDAAETVHISVLLNRYLFHLCVGVGVRERERESVCVCV